MRIAVNAQVLFESKLEGLGWFTYEVLSRIVRNHPEHTFIFIFSRPYPDKFIFGPNVEPIVLSPKYGHPLVWLYKFLFAMPRLLNKTKADIYLSPDGWCPRPCNIKQVAVIHDLNFMHHPEWLSFSYRHYYRYFFRRWAHSASQLATVSEFSKNDICQRFGIAANNIDVVYNGIGSFFSPSGDDKKTETRLKWTETKPYFVFVGASPPRKNLVNLFRAFDIFKQDAKTEHKLVIAGAKHWWAEYIRNAYESMEYRADVIFTDRLNPEDLNSILGAAEALVYPSLFEGFGIPIIEAMRCHTPVITSSCTSMPEIAADAALLIDPYKPHEIAAAMHRIASEPELRNKLISKGSKRAEFFSWDKSAELLWRCIEKAIKC
jgi:glycosyltransferase involved in cell wall biosynthesis